MMLALVAGLVRAGDFGFEEGGVALWLPDSWSVDIEDGRLAAVSVDGNAAVELVVLKGAAELETAERSCRARLAQSYRQWRETAARREASLGGMRGFTFSGEGVRDGVRRSVRVVVFKAPQRYLMLAWSAESARAAQSKAAYDQIAASVKAVRR